MRNYRRAGQCLLVGILLPLLILGLHPTAHDLTADSGTRLTIINHLVHGIALAAQPLIVLGVLGLSRYLGWTDLATAAFVVYAFGVVATLAAALMSGFVASDVIAQLRGGDPGTAPQYQALLDYTHYLNQAFAKVSVIAVGIALLLWSLDIVQTRHLSRLTGLVGMLVGTFLTVGILSGQLALNVRGILLATGVQAAWMALVAVQLMRLPPLVQE
jgi:hypothetical protein